MKTKKAISPIIVDIPETRQPFVNTPLLALGPGKDGKERFWISTWNANEGSTGVLVTEDGECRTYRFKTGFGGYYSAAQEDANTLWLCGCLSFVIRLNLKTGKHTVHKTGAPPALVFQGMVLDSKTHKLFALAYPSEGTTAFSFDMVKRKPVRIYNNVCPEHYMRSSFSHGDGTWSVMVQIPGEVRLHWNPKTETVKTSNLRKTVDPHAVGGSSRRVIQDRKGHTYLPGSGWFNPKTRRCSNRSPRPEREACWFSRRGEIAYGSILKGEQLDVLRWEMKTGSVQTLCAVPNSHCLNVNTTANDAVIAVNMYGEFFRFNGTSGALEISKSLPVTGINHVDCLRRIDKTRILGTPFITQRFWELDLATGKGEDCGRAAPSSGEILRTWKVGKKIYMAAYTGGELTEYDPNLPARFPENPRVVAAPKHAMRPIASAQAGHIIFYACSRPYGTLGSVLVRYDTRTGMTQSAEDLLGPRKIVGLWYQKKSNTLLCGSSIHADCSSCPPTAETAICAELDADTLEVKNTVHPDKPVQEICFLGVLDHRHLVAVAHTPDGSRWGALRRNPLTLPRFTDLQPFPAPNVPVYSGKPGLFIFCNEQRVELWDLKKSRQEGLLCRIPSRIGPPRKIFVEDSTLFVVTMKKLAVFEDLL